MRFVSSNKFNNGAVITVNAGGTFDVVGSNDTISHITGAGLVTGTTTGFLTLSGTGAGGGSAAFSGVIGGDMGLRTSNAALNLTLSGNNTYPAAPSLPPAP
jgi:hypothetical protein